MLSWLLDAILTESRWLAVAMVAGGLGVVLSWWSTRGSRDRGAILSAMHLFYGSMIGTMGFGHLLAVSLELALGHGLRTTPFVLYLIGLVLALPAGALALRGWRFRGRSDPLPRRAMALNGFLGLALLALGPHNAPLAAPALLNILYGVVRQRAVAWAIVGVAVVGYAVLFAGALFFFASGQSFEQFSGMD